MSNPGLLPSGVHDLLPPYAAHESWLVERCVTFFEGHGYQRVKPPLIEFEASLGLFAGCSPGRGFRWLDPPSGQIMEVRTDVTPQIARIACTRMAQLERPLRLAYAGSVLLADGLQCQREQVGLELIGSERPEADLEVLRLVCESAQMLGVQALSLDMYTPTLLPKLGQVFGLNKERIRFLALAVNNKDHSSVSEQAGPAREVLESLMESSGEFATAIPKLQRFAMPAGVGGGMIETELHRLIDIAQRLHDELPWLEITIDALESKGNSYEEGVSFTLFAHGSPPVELGKGGRYKAGGDHANATLEPAVGATLYGEQLMQIVPGPQLPKSVFLPYEDTLATGSQSTRLRVAGWVTKAGLEPVEDNYAEACRLGCSHVMIEQELVPLADTALAGVVLADSDN